MSLKDHAILVSLTVTKPQMTKKDSKATKDAEDANHAQGAGQYRKDLYPKHLVAPIATLESSARAFITSTTYPWNRGQALLPSQRFIEFAERLSKYELEFNQAVTAFLNNWANVMQQAETAQGDLFDSNAYPDLQELKAQFQFRVNYAPVADASDFRVALQEEEMDMLREETRKAMESQMRDVLTAPLERLRSVVKNLHDKMALPERTVEDKRTGKIETKPPIFRDSICENIAEEINLLYDFAGILPDNVIALANETISSVPQPEELRSSDAVRAQTFEKTGSLLNIIDDLLED